MNSLSRAFFRFVIDKSANYALNADVPVPTQRRRLDFLGRALLPARGARKSVTTLGDLPALLVSGTWSNGANDPVILYLHGGAFIIGSSVSHYSLVTHIARAAGAEIWLPDYRLAPEHPCPAALEDALTCYQALLDAGTSPERIIIMGDSAGGQLTLASCQAIRDRGLPRPAGMAMFSPLADGSFSGDSMNANDPVLTVAWMECGVQHYTGELPREDPRISPLFADMQGLPPALLHVGTDERLLDDSRRLHRAFNEAGVDCEYLEAEGLWHVWHYLAGGGFSEAREAIRRVGDWCREQIKR